MKQVTKHKKLVRKVITLMVVSFMVGMVFSVAAITTNSRINTVNLMAAHNQQQRSDWLVNAGTLFFVLFFLALLFVVVLMAYDRWNPPQGK